MAAAAARSKASGSSSKVTQGSPSSFGASSSKFHAKLSQLHSSKSREMEISEVLGTPLVGGAHSKSNEHMSNKGLTGTQEEVVEVIPNKALFMGTSKTNVLSSKKQLDNNNNNNNRSTLCVVGSNVHRGTSRIADLRKSISAPSSPQKHPSKGLLAALSTRNRVMKAGESKILVTISVLGSTGPLRFLADVANTVEQIIEISLRTYGAQGRLPLLGCNAKLFELYCNDGEFKALDSTQCIGALECRHFLVHKKRDGGLAEDDDFQAWNWKCWGTMVCSN